MHMKVSYHKTSFSRATRDITPPRISTDSLFSFSAAKIDSESQISSFNLGRKERASRHFYSSFYYFCYFSSLLSKIKVKLNRQTVKSVNNHLFSISMVAIQGLSSACETSLLLLWWGFPAGLGHMHSWSRRVLIKTLSVEKCEESRLQETIHTNWQLFTVWRIRRPPPPSFSPMSEFDLVLASI